MRALLDFLVRHGYAVVFWLVLAEQLGLPLPAVPVLLAAGALCGQGQLGLATVLGLTVVAATLGDSAWFVAGRYRGPQVLRLVCRVTLEPDSCVRRTEDIFVRHGARSLVAAKFIPGLSTVAPPLAGMFRMRPVRFVLFDLLGTVLYAGTYVGIGYAFSEQIEKVVDHAVALGRWLGVIVALATVLWLGAKYIQRHRFMRDLRIARIAPEELKARLDLGEDVVIVDLRHSLDFDASPAMIPGARHIDPDEFAARHGEIPREREIILYCT